jgi:hypothetical protein
LLTTNPFKEADRIVIEVKPEIKFIGYKAITDLPTFLVVIQQGSSAISNVLGELKYISATWQPTLSSPDSMGNPTQLDSFGFLKFTITTKNNQPPPTLVINALKGGELNYLTPFIASTGGNITKIGNIPLSGAGFGSGSIFDYASKTTLQLRTNTTDVSWDGSKINITVQLLVLHVSGRVADVYQQKYWDYISQVNSARVVLPSSTGIASPAAWGI